jgi:hypothetical protein
MSDKTLSNKFLSESFIAISVYCKDFYQSGGGVHDRKRGYARSS